MPGLFSHPLSSLLARLPGRSAFDEADYAAFLGLRPRIEVRPTGCRLVSQGDFIENSIFLIDGFISRTKLLRDRQQVIAFCLPGDAVDLQTLFLKNADHCLETHAPSTVAIIPQADIANLMMTRPKIMRSLWLEALVEAAIFREWSLSLGSRNGRQRIAHLLLELETRYQARTTQARGPFILPVKQAAIASAVGLSLVHFNKSLNWLRRAGLIDVNGREFEIIKRDELTAFCDFDPTYLHLRTNRSTEDLQFIAAAKSKTA